jgi:hypothetical protein
MGVVRLFDQCQRKRSDPRAALRADATHRAYGMNVSNSSMLIPRYLMLHMGVIISLLIESCGSVARSTILWWLALGRQCSSSDFGGEKQSPRYLLYSVWYSMYSFRHCRAKVFELADWRKPVLST